MIYALLGAATARSEAPWSFNVQVLRNTLLGSTRLQCIHLARRSSPDGHRPAALLLLGSRAGLMTSTRLERPQQRYRSRCVFASDDLCNLAGCQRLIPAFNL